MKKIFAMGIALVMLIASVGAFAQEAAPYIGVTIFDYSNNFVGYIRNGIDYYIANEVDGVEYMIVDGENNQATQTERIDTMINRGVNALAVNPVDSSACQTIVDKAREAGIPIVFFNRMPPMDVLGSYDKCWYVGSNVVYQGELEGEMVADAWIKDQTKYDTNGDGVLQYVLLKGTPGHSDAEDRVNGFYAAIEAAGIQVEELASDAANWNTALAKDMTETWIGKYGDQIEMVVSGNDAMALGAVEALRANDMINDKRAVPVIGVNALPEASELIQSGVMLGSVLTSPYGISCAVIDILNNAVKGVDVAEGTDFVLEDGKIVRIPESKITAENVNDSISAYKIASN